jgi:uncharacterized sulfatase
MVAAFDAHATALAAAGVPPGEIDGVDLLPFLDGRRESPVHSQLFWREGRLHGARLGHWKLVRGLRGRDALYDLSADLGESNDLAAVQPDRLAKLRAAFDAWSAQMQPARWTYQHQHNAEPGGKPKQAAPRPQ